MISSVPSYDEELLNSAYANIGLIADKVWAFHQDDPFRKLNHTLWVQNCKLTAKYRENGNYQPRCVRNTIPGSWLAQYGNYEYNEERERLYKSGDNGPTIRQTDINNGEVTEPWMLDEVEKHFTRLSSRNLLLLDDEISTLQLKNSTTDKLDPPVKVTAPETGQIVLPKWDVVLRKRYSTLGQVLAVKTSNGKETTSWIPAHIGNMDESHNKHVDPEDYIKYPPLRYTVENMAEMQLQINVTSDAVRDLWNPSKSPQKQEHQQQQKRRLYQKPQQQQQQQQQKHSQYINRHQQHMQCGRQPQQHNFHSNNQQQYIQCGMQHQTAAMRPGRHSTCPESIGITRQPQLPILSAEVPEFFPKRPMCRTKVHQEQSVPLQFFPSSADRSYQDELFPYNRGHVPASGNVYQSTSIPVPSIPIQQIPNTSCLTRTSHQWIQRPTPALHVQVPVCPPAHQSLCTSVQPVCPTYTIQRHVEIHDKLLGNIAPQGGLPSAPIPVYQRPPELYNDPSQRRKNQGVDFNNLILLTKNAMKARRNQSKQSNIKSETDVTRWFEKGCKNKKAKEIVAMDILVRSKFENFEEKSNDEETVCLKENTEDLTTNIDCKKSPVKLNDTDPSSDQPTKRRLYRDVLTNSSSTGISMENVFDKRYDELERQAMEQYRTSEECLALRYQELERQAMEQYKNCDHGAGSSSNIQSQSLSPVTPTKGKQQDQNKSINDPKVCFGNHKCSGFGHCSPMKNSQSTASEKGTKTRQQLTILKPESKIGTSVTHRMVNHNECSRPAIVTKSLTTLNQRFTRDSKNTTRGASGDKIDGIVQGSPKRRLILMSPSKRESEARPTRSNLEETFTFESMNAHVSSGSYRKEEVMKTGGGDEKITILRSAESEGIRNQLFLANEELMDSSLESLGVRLLEPTEKIDESYEKMELVGDFKEQIIDLSSGMSIASIIDVGIQEEEEHLTKLQKYEITSNRITRNKKKRCKPHNLITDEKPQFHQPNPSPTRSITLLLITDEKPKFHQPNPSPTNPHLLPHENYEVKLVDNVQQHYVLALKGHREPRKPHYKVKLKSKYKKICLLPELRQTTLKKGNFLKLSNYFSSYFPIVLERGNYCQLACKFETNCEISQIFILSNESYLLEKQFKFETEHVYLLNEIYSSNIIMARYYEILLAKGQKIQLLIPLGVLPSLNNSKTKYLQEILGCEKTSQKINTNDFLKTDDCIQLTYSEKLRYKTVDKFHLDLNNLQLFNPIYLVEIFHDDLYVSQKKNVHYILTNLENYLSILRSDKHREQKI